jgi:hypothetical protein
MFSVGSVLGNYKTAQSEDLKEYKGVQWSSVGSQNSSSGVPSRKMTVCQIVICELL